MNFKFYYFYRDGSNFKNFNEIVFSNPSGISIDKVLSTIKKNLIDEKWFVANEWDVPDLHFKEFGWDSEIDHEWHEFETVEYTLEEPTEEKGINDFLNLINSKKLEL